TYPATAQSFRARSWIDPALREGGTGVLIVQNPLGLEPVHWLNSRVNGRGGTTYFDLEDRRARTHLPPGKGLIVYSQSLTRDMMLNYPPQTRFASKWDDVMQILREKYKQ